MKILSFLILFLFTTSYAQIGVYNVNLIPDKLNQNANAVIRLSDRTVTINSQKEMKIVSKTVTTVLNEVGLRNLDLTEHFDKNTRITKIEAKVYNAIGLEIKSFKRKDFKDVSVADGVSIFNDNRMLYLDYTPVVYPFTIEFNSEIETSNTAFVFPWYPITSNYESVEFSKVTVNCNSDLGLRYKENNFSDKYAIQKSENALSISYSVMGIEAVKGEDYAPNFTKVVPSVNFALTKFHLEGVNGVAKNWEEFGKWYYDALLTGTDELPENTIANIKKLVGSETNPLEISKIVYDYVQQKTRYVLVLVGIGGWKPMLAKDVDRLGYGDCKALTNYTRALLKAVNVPSYYTIVHSGSNDRMDIKEDFTSIQGNHIILSIPYNNELYWLECTSQTMPFGFQGDFTDDRKVVLIKPNGGEIVTTKAFTEIDTKRKSVGTFELDNKGTIRGVVKINSTGIEYDNRYFIERQSQEDKVKYYKSFYNNINNLKIDKISVVNNRDKIVFDEEISFSAEGYATKMGDKIMLPVNVLNPIIYVPKKHRNRDKPFEILRGKTIVEESYIKIPIEYVVEALPESVNFESKYGSYSCHTKLNDKSQIVFIKTFVLKKGFHDRENFEEFRIFLEKVSRNDNAKAIIKLN